MLAATGTSAPVATGVLAIVASGSTSVAGGLTTGGGGPGGLESVSPGFATKLGGVTGAGGGKEAREADVSSAGRSSSLFVELSPLAATPAPCGLPFFDLWSSIKAQVPQVLMRRKKRACRSESISISKHESSFLKLITRPEVRQEGQAAWSAGWAGSERGWTPVGSGESAIRPKGSI